MKKLILWSTFLFGIIIQAHAQEGFKLTVVFLGLESNEGNVFVGLHDKEKDFLKKRCGEAVVKVEAGKATVFFENLMAGEYAISAFHDENDNKKLDTNFVGIPKEPIGISNNAKGFLGPPKYEDAKFKIVEDMVIEIAIQ